MTKTTIACMTLFAAAGVCFAGPVSFDFEGVARGQNVYIEVGDTFAGNVFAGSVKHRVDGELLLTYCIDPDQHAQTGVTNFERTKVWKALRDRDNYQAKANAIAELADSLGDTLWALDADRNIAAAFQLAAWEIIKDFDSGLGVSSFDFTSGDFRASGNTSLFQTAGNMLSGLSFTRGNDDGYTAYAHPDHQDFMSQSVPAPGAIALGIAGMPLLASRRRRR